MSLTIVLISSDNPTIPVFITHTMNSQVVLSLFGSQYLKNQSFVPLDYERYVQFKSFRRPRLNYTFVSKNYNLESIKF